MVSSGAASPRGRNGPRTRHLTPSKKISAPSNSSAEASARVSVELSSGFSSSLSPSANAAATSARFVTLLLPGMRRAPARRRRGSGRGALTSPRRSPSRRRRSRERPEAASHRARGGLLLDDGEAALGRDLGVLPLLEPRGQDVRDGPGAHERAGDVEVADEERVVARAARRAAFRAGARPLEASSCA